VARAVESALHWPGPGATVLNIGTGTNHSVMDMLPAVSNSGHAPPIDHQSAHPADVPATLASIRSANRELGWGTHDRLPERTAHLRSTAPALHFFGASFAPLYTSRGPEILLESLPANRANPIRL